MANVVRPDYNHSGGSWSNDLFKIST